MPKRKKSRDPEYRPTKKTTNRPEKRNTEGLFKLMGVSTPKAKTMAVTGFDVSTPPNTRLRGTPDLNQVSSPQTNHRGVVETPTGTQLAVSREISMNGKKIAVYLPMEKIGLEHLDIPPANPERLSTITTIPQGTLEPTLDIRVTKQDLQRTNKEKQQANRSGQSIRYPTQKQVFGMSARDALNQATGKDFAPNTVHLIHLLSHSIGGNKKTQDINNLCIATKNCNAEMELVNRVIEKILYANDQPNALYLSYYPEWHTGYEKIRLLSKLTIEIKDFPKTECSKKVSFSFDTLTLKKICTSEISILEELLETTFRNTTPSPTQKFQLTPTGLTKIRPRILSDTPKLSCLTLPDATDSAFLPKSPTVFHALLTREGSSKSLSPSCQLSTDLNSSSTDSKRAEKKARYS